MVPSWEVNNTYSDPKMLSYVLRHEDLYCVGSEIGVGHSSYWRLSMAASTFKLSSLPKVGTFREVCYDINACVLRKFTC